MKKEKEEISKMADKMIEDTKLLIKQYDVLAISDGIFEDKTKTAMKLALNLYMIRIMIGEDKFRTLKTFSTKLEEVRAYLLEYSDKEQI